MHQKETVETEVCRTCSKTWTTFFENRNARLRGGAVPGLPTGALARVAPGLACCLRPAGLRAGWAVQAALRPAWALEKAEFGLTLS